MKVKLFFAGNFEIMNYPKKEKEFALFCEKEFGSYNRLGSFFFGRETEKLLGVTREIQNENKHG